MQVETTLWQPPLADMPVERQPICAESKSGSRRKETGRGRKDSCLRPGKAKGGDGVEGVTGWVMPHHAGLLRRI